MTSFRLALAQMPVIGGRPEDNLRRAANCIAEAAAAGTEIVLLPEALDCGWCHGSARALAEPIPDGAACLRLREAARTHAVHVCAGLIERCGDRLYNSAVLISPAGEVLLHHRKINELAMAHDLYGCGDRLGVADTPLGTIGLIICADAFAPGQVMSRSLALMGAQIILSPCAWAVPPDYDAAAQPYGQLWLDHYGAVARDHRVWIAGASNVGQITDGEWAGHSCIGCSLVVAPTGLPFVRGPYGAGAAAMLFAEIQLAESAARPDGSIPAGP